jgi:hypothetical protein
MPNSKSLCRNSKRNTNKKTKVDDLTELLFESQLNNLTKIYDKLNESFSINDIFESVNSNGKKTLVVNHSIPSYAER